MLPGDASVPFLTSVARAIPNDELAQAVARQRIASHLSNHHVAPLADCIYVGLSGVARQTIYRQAPHDVEREPPRPQTAIEVLILLAAAGGFASPTHLAAPACLSGPLVTAVMTDLALDGLSTIRRDDYASLEGAPTERTYQALREHFDDLYLRRADHYSVYARVPPNHEDEIRRGAAAVLAGHEHDVLPQSVAPSTMVGSELAFVVAAPTTRRALDVARELWRDILDTQGLEYFEPVITNVIPPASRPSVPSEVLDTFLESVVDAGAPNGDGVRQVRGAYPGGTSERELAGRCVTLAALALRRTVGNTSHPRPITDGDAAFAEYEPAHGVPTDKAGTPVKKAAISALDLAIERLGPFPGGRLASFRAPGQAPNVLTPRRPSHDELVEMARRSGTAVGAAANIGRIDAAFAMQWLVTGADT
jgi:hypothetical protein